MKLIISFFCVLLIYGCSVENIDPELVDEYFFRKEIANPTALPTAIDLKGVYHCKVQAVSSTETASFDPINFEFQSTVQALNDSNFNLSVPQDCVFKCDNSYRLLPEIKIEASIIGFSIILPNQLIGKSNFGDNISISNGKGIIDRSKNTITIAFRIVFNRIEKTDFTYTLTRKL